MNCRVQLALGTFVLRCNLPTGHEGSHHARWDNARDKIVVSWRRSIILKQLRTRIQYLKDREWVMRLLGEIGITNSMNSIATRMNCLRNYGESFPKKGAVLMTNGNTSEPIIGNLSGKSLFGGLSGWMFRLPNDSQMVKAGLNSLISRLILTNV